MTTATPSPGNSLALPDYLADMQSRAGRLLGVLEALNHLEQEGAMPESRATLAFLAVTMASDLNNALNRESTLKGEIK